MLLLAFIAAFHTNSTNRLVAASAPVVRHFFPFDSSTISATHEFLTGFTELGMFCISGTNRSVFVTVFFWVAIGTGQDMMAVGTLEQWLTGARWCLTNRATRLGTAVATHWCVRIQFFVFSATTTEKML